MESHSSITECVLKKDDELSLRILSWIEEKNTDTIIIIWNSDRKLIYVSSLIETLLGYQPDKVYGMKWLDVFSNEMIDLINKIFDGVYDEDDVVNVELNSQECEKSTFDCSFGQLKSGSNEEFYLCQLKNTTQKKALESKIKHLKEVSIHSEKMTIAGEFSAGLIHEIRNPLTSLKGFLQLVQAGIQQKEEYYRVMIDEIDKIEAITSELLTMSKPFSNVMKSESVHRLIRDAVFLMKSQKSFKEILFEVNYTEDKLIFCDQHQIKQVFINLFKNAAEAMEMKGKIMINIRETAEAIEIDIVDEGEGIPDDTIFEIGKPFFTTKETGTGLGLMVTKHILEQHNAEMKASSNKSGGSTFRIIFPRS